MQIQSVVVSADAQAVTGECYFVGVTISDQTGDGACILYNENDSSKTATKALCEIRASDEMQSNSIILPLPGVKCDGIYADWTAGVTTIFYYRP